MFKKLLISTLFFVDIALFAATDSSRKVTLNFTDERLNTLQFDPTLGSPLEQFLDAGFTHITLKTSAQPFTILEKYTSNTSSNNPGNWIRVHNSCKYSSQIDQELRSSTLLAAAVYRQLNAIGDSQSLHVAGEHGIWQCHTGNCFQLSSQDLQMLTEEIKRAQNIRKQCEQKARDAYKPFDYTYGGRGQPE